ncbi:ATP-binding protein [Streptomyces sp. NPDC058246]|uniref:sensor histidine kinase n=1 Tax=Streptomyces sp. NPDC058246 TaxID=3346400 RepID=UPI0036E6ECDE
MTQPVWRSLSTSFTTKQRVPASSAGQAARAVRFEAYQESAVAGTAKDMVFAEYGRRIQLLRYWFRLALAAMLTVTAIMDTPRDRWQALLWVVGAYTVCTLGGLLWWYANPPQRLYVPAVAASGIIDVIAVFLLLQLSDGPNLFLPFLFVLPLFCAFNIRLGTTAITLAFNAVAFVVALTTDPAAVTELTWLRVWILVCAHLMVCALVFLLSAAHRSRTLRIGELIDARADLLAQVIGAEEHQRKIMAEAIHDGPLQSILASRHDLEEFADTGDRTALSRADVTLTEVAQDLRQTTYQLHPAVLEAAGLAAAIRSLAQTAQTRGKMTAECDLPEVPNTHDVLLFGVARELIGNAVRHSEASHLRIKLRQLDGSICLTVTDDGKGFDPTMLPDRLARGHIGLASLRVRVEAAHGRFDFLPVARGTSVRVCLPGRTPAVPSDTLRGESDLTRLGNSAPFG